MKRNIHDGFLYRTQPDHSKYPKLVQYRKDDSFVHWDDFEMKVNSREIATSAAAQVQRFVDRDSPTQTLKPFTTHVTSTDLAQAEPQNSFRHFISIPYEDHNALEDLYVSMIDSAVLSTGVAEAFRKMWKMDM